MRTWVAALSHIGLASLQAVSAVQFFDNSHPAGFLGNMYAQIGAQTGLSLFQAWVAKKNSDTDKNGNPVPAATVAASVAQAAAVGK